MTGGWHHSPEARRRIAEAHRGKPLPQEIRRKISEALKGRSLPLEVRKKLSDAHRGEKNHFYRKHHTPEAREKMSEAARGKYSGERNPNFGQHHTPEAREKIRAAKLGKPGHPCSQETKRKLIEANLGSHRSEESRRKMSEAARGKPHPWQQGIALSPEAREKIRAASKARWQDPEYRVKMSGENNPQWRGGVSFGKYCQKFNNEFKERVRAFWGHQCALCGKSQGENGRKLGVHHVNYRKDACCNEEAQRYFVPLCTLCHGETNHERERWEKKLTSIIEKKYSGKCYFHQKEVLTAWGVEVATP